MHPMGLIRSRDLPGINPKYLYKQGERSVVHRAVLTLTGMFAGLATLTAAADAPIPKLAPQIPPHVRVAQEIAKTSHEQLMTEAYARAHQREIELSYDLTARVLKKNETLVLRTLESLAPYGVKTFSQAHHNFTSAVTDFNFAHDQAPHVKLDAMMALQIRINELQVDVEKQLVGQELTLFAKKQKCDLQNLNVIVSDNSDWNFGKLGQYRIVYSNALDHQAKMDPGKPS